MKYLLLTAGKANLRYICCLKIRKAMHLQQQIDSSLSLLEEMTVTIIQLIEIVYINRVKKLHELIEMEALPVSKSNL